MQSYQHEDYRLYTTDFMMLTLIIHSSLIAFQFSLTV